MKYFVGYLIQGETATWHINLAKNIADKFNTWKLHEKIPPHITIFYLSEVENILPVKNLLRDWVQNKKVSGNFTIQDFDHFEDRVVFAKTEPDDSVRSMIEGLIKRLKQIPSMTQEDYPVWHPHATLANKLTPEEINQIWEYVGTLEKPDFVIPFDNVTIFRFEGDQKWVMEESFKINKSVV